MAAFAELAAIFCVSNIIFRKWKIPGQIVNGILLLLYSAQMLVLLFGGTFITQAMITNLDSLEDLGGKTFIYGTGVVLVLCISLLPSRYVDLKHFTWGGILSAVLALELVFTLVSGNSFSPFYAYNVLRNDLKETRRLTEAIGGVDEDMTRHFWDYAYYNFKNKPENLPEKPNVVIIFTEGSLRVLWKTREVLCPTWLIWKRSRCSSKIILITLSRPTKD